LQHKESERNDMAITLIEPNDSGERQHRANLRSLLEQVDGTVRIASAYVTDTSLLLGAKGHDVRLLTHISRKDIIFGATSLQSLHALIEAGMQCRYLSGEPRLHAKVYLFGSRSAVVTSANLTQKALDRNLEVGVRFDGIEVAQLVNWFDKLWDEAEALDPEMIIAWWRETEAERTELFALCKRAEKQPELSSNRATKLRNLFESDNCLFVCNTNRRYSLNDEKTMHQRGYAAAWEDFHFPSHMDRVKKGDTICMYAKGKGIIGIGRAKGPVEKLEPGTSGRVAPDGKREWRVPTDWLVWKDDSAFRWSSPNSTFFEVSGDKALREDLKKHFQEFL
jgi:PLD-like domain